MNHKYDILQTLTEIIKRFFKNEDLKVTLKTTANDIEEWDSLNHMDLIRTIELEFLIEFDFFEVMDFENISELVNSIENKI